jgi:hypothetical protein
MAKTELEQSRKELPEVDIAELVLGVGFPEDRVRRWIKDGCWRGLPVLLHTARSPNYHTIASFLWTQVLGGQVRYHRVGAYLLDYTRRVPPRRIYSNYSLSERKATELVLSMPRGKVVDWLEEANLPLVKIHERIERDVKKWRVRVPI